MSQERWDVVLKFLEGPLAFQGDLVCRGPVVRMGSNPGPGGLKLEGYRALDDRQAVIQSYDGGTVSVAPVGTNQVRVAPHENVDWNEIPPIRGPIYLSNGSAFHLGPPGRGCTAIFVESRRLGVWEQRQLLSEAGQVEGEGSDVKELDVQRGRPAWFIPSMVMIGVAISTGVIIQFVKPPPIPPLGPVAQGEEHYQFVDISQPVDERLIEGFNQPFNDFLMVPNSKAADWPELVNTKQWDQKFLTYVTRSAEYHSRAWSFWQRLEEIHESYAYVVTQLRAEGLPEVFAGIPYQESGYRAESQSYVCAKGFWQFMPEVANRMKLGVSSCKLSQIPDRWTPTGIVVPPEAKRVYQDLSAGISARACRIQSCEVDERMDLQASTRAALEMLKEPMTDPELMQSGAVVQMAILTHNTGYDDGRFVKGRRGGVLNAWRGYADAKKVTRAPEFYGANILCTDKNAAPNDRCGGYLPKETQHYAYNIVAQHILAVCYYAKNYGSDPAFDAWRPYTLGTGYCTKVQVPDSEKVRANAGGRK